MAGGGQLDEDHRTMSPRDGDMFMFQNFVMPIMARQALESTDNTLEADSAFFSDIAASPYAYLVPVLHAESVNGAK